MIHFEIINNEELESSIKRFDAKILFLKNQFNIESKTYGNILRIALNTIQNEMFDNLIERVEINKELESALAHEGGYTIDFISENNPKTELINLLNFLKESSLKKQRLFNHIQKNNKREILITDANDIDFIKKYNRNSRLEILSFTTLKKSDILNKALVFHSFNGQKDFDYLYNLDSEITMILYEQEHQLYQKQINNRKSLIEDEIRNEDRLKLCGLTYTTMPDRPVNISGTIENIVNRLDDWGSRAYDGYKNECDLLLDEIEEKVICKITSENKVFYLDSNDTIFNNTGDLIKAYKIKIGDTIRIYPKEQLAENLYQVAVETEPEIFGKVEEHSIFWKKLISELRAKYGSEMLYQHLKGKGLRVLPSTLEAYGKSNRKFPMFNNDLRAIFKLYYPIKNDDEIDLVLKPILKSKTTYNSTMIVLGRGLKQELRLFLKEKRIGEILEKRNFNANTLQVFIDEFMPLYKITAKEVLNEELDNSLFEQIEL
ncbi:MAG: hypothetical protein WDO71_03405 [Bacteroidota bacterium]